MLNTCNIFFFFLSSMAIHKKKKTKTLTTINLQIMHATLPFDCVICLCSFEVVRTSHNKVSVDPWNLELMTLGRLSKYGRMKKDIYMLNWHWDVKEGASSTWKLTVSIAQCVYFNAHCQSNNETQSSFYFLAICQSIVLAKTCTSSIARVHLNGSMYEQMNIKHLFHLLFEHFPFHYCANIAHVE